MREVELRRSPADRRLFEAQGVGWLRTASWLSQRGEAGAAGSTTAEWAFEPRGWTGARAEAIDRRSGLPIGGYRRTGTFSQDGEVTWGGRVHGLGRASRWRQRFRLVDGRATLLELDVRGYGRRPVTLRVDPALEGQPGLVLFACWLGTQFVAQASAASASG